MAESLSVTTGIPSTHPVEPAMTLENPRAKERASMYFPRPAIRVTSEFDSDTSTFAHKISCKLLDGLAKLKLSFDNDKKGEFSAPQLGFITKYLSIFYDSEESNVFVKGSFDIGNALHFSAAQDVKSCQHGEPICFHVGCSTQYFCVSCTCDDRRSIVSSINCASLALFKYHQKKVRQGELAMVANLFNPSYKLELSSAIPSIGLPKATIRFPLGEVSLEEKEEEEKTVLSVSGIVKGQLLNGICLAQYKDEDLNLRYAYKDEEMSFLPSISLPSNAMSFAFKRRFGPSDKLSYWYNFGSCDWSTVYKHTIGKDLKFKAGYDSAVRLGWASFWVGDEYGKSKTAPMKMKVQVMVQVPTDNIESSLIMFRVKKRWDV